MNHLALRVGEMTRLDIAVSESTPASLAYVSAASCHQPGRRLQPLAAVVFAGPRYQSAPVSFLDVVISPRDTRPVTSLDSLRGAVAGEVAGVSALRERLLRRVLVHRGFYGAFFRHHQAFESSRHALMALHTGVIGAAIVESADLHLELLELGQRTPGFQIIDTLGPFPSAVWAARADLDARVQRRIQAALLELSVDPVAAGTLRQVGIRAFVRPPKLEVAAVQQPVAA